MLYSPLKMDQSTMLLPWLLLATLLTSPILYYMIISRKSKTSNKINLPSSPKQLPIIGNLHQLGTHMHRSLWTLSQEHGQLMHLKLGFRHAVVVSSSHMAKQVLKVHDLDFCSRPNFISWAKYAYNYSDINFSPYGDSWRQMRKVCILELFSIKRNEMFRSVREEEVSLMIQSIAKASNMSLEIDINSEMFTLANNVICRVAFGKRLKGNFDRILERFEENLGCFYFGDYFPLLGYWIDILRGKIAKLERNVRELDAVYEEVIQNHLDSRRMKDEHEDVVDVLLHLQREEGVITMGNIKGVLMDIFIAGTQTTSSTLVWAMTELAKNPNTMKKAQEEIELYIKKDQDQIYEKDLHNLQYIKLIVKETLRLHAPVPLLLPRQAMQHCEVEGYDIMQNTLIYVNAWAIGRDSKVWDKAEEFIPERFLNSLIDYKGHDFEFIPFGSGRRICPAMNAGVTTIELALANLLYCFDWALPRGINCEDIDMDEAPGISLQKKTPLKLLALRKQF